jgi:hypothetical protein
MDKTLRFEIDVEYEERKWKHANCSKHQLMAEILRDFERRGNAMRHLNAQGEIAWKPSPAMLMELADAEAEVEADFADFP